jgi:hypothetical protein
MARLESRLYRGNIRESTSIFRAVSNGKFFQGIPECLYRTKQQWEAGCYEEALPGGKGRKSRLMLNCSADPPPIIRKTF